MESKIDLENFCVDITDPVNTELLPGFKEWVNKQPCLNSYCTIGSWVFKATYYGTFNGKIYSDNIVSDLKSPLTTLPELQKQHPGVFENVRKCEGCGENTDAALCETCYEKALCNGRPVPTPSFKAGQEVEYSNDNNEWHTGIYHGMKISNTPQAKEWPYIIEQEGGLLSTARFIRPIPEQPTMESEIENILAKINGRTYNDKDATRDILAWHQKHSGRVEVSVPTKEERDNELSKRKFNNNFNAESNFMQGWNQCYEWMRDNFMTRKEQQDNGK